jgi:hypothetical protein
MKLHARVVHEVHMSCMRTTPAYWMRYIRSVLAYSHVSTKLKAIPYTLYFTFVSVEISIRCN